MIVHGVQESIAAEPSLAERTADLFCAIVNLWDRVYGPIGGS